MLAGVPVIAGRVGGLPEAVIDGLTGSLVSVRQPLELAQTVLRVLAAPLQYGTLARNAQTLIREMVSTERIGREVLRIYAHTLSGEAAPPRHFDPLAALDASLACARFAVDRSARQ